MQNGDAVSLGTAQRCAIGDCPWLNMARPARHCSAGTVPVAHAGQVEHAVPVAHAGLPFSKHRNPAA